jgi:hypothetical protein
MGADAQKPNEDHEQTDDGRTAKHAFDAAQQTPGAVRARPARVPTGGSHTRGYT